MFEITSAQQVITSQNIQANDKITHLISTSADSQSGYKVVALYESGAVQVLVPNEDQLEEHWSFKPQTVDNKHAQIAFYDNEVRFAIATKKHIQVYDIELGDTLKDDYDITSKQPYAMVDTPYEKNILVADKVNLHLVNTVHKKISHSFELANTQRLLWLDHERLLIAASLESDEPAYRIWKRSNIVSGIQEGSPKQRSARSGSVRERLGSDLSNHLSFKPQMIKLANNKIATTHPRGIKLWNIKDDNVEFEQLIQIPGVNQLMLLPDNYLLSTTSDQTIIWNLQDCKAVYQSDNVLQHVVALHDKSNHYVCVDKEGKLQLSTIKRSDLSATHTPIVNTNIYSNTPTDNRFADKQTSSSAGTAPSTSISSLDMVEEDKAQKKKCCIFL